jgi:hypothetical protein
MRSRDLLRRRRRPNARAAERRDEKTDGRRRSRSAPVEAARRSALRLPALALLTLIFAALALGVYAPSLRGPFVSDDLHYVATNPYVHDLGLDNLLAILDPRSPATLFVVNYAPVHLLLHALTWQAVGEQTTAYHVVNVLLHALGSALLALVFSRAGLPRAVAVGAALVFLLHPANVEAVAWISQAKTPLAFVLSLSALLAHPRRPALATVAFALALLAKPTAAFALPVAAALEWSREGRVRPGWLGAWAALLAAYAVGEFATHQRTGAADPIDSSWPVRLRTIAAIWARYLWMSATSLGVSTFHEPAPVRSWLDAWLVAGLASGAALLWRCGVLLRRGGPELAFWIWAVVSFAPISQLFPFLHPMADRYLYFILSGLLGGVAFAGRDVGRRLVAGGAPEAWLERAATGAALAVVVAFGVHSFERARLWSSPARIVLDAARHYPEGRTARIVEARRAAQAGDTATAIRALQRAAELGLNHYQQLVGDPSLAPLQRDPRFRALVHEMAGWWVRKLSSLPDPTQIELRTLAQAHLARGERELALRALERAASARGPLDAQLREEISRVRATPD